MGGAFRFTRRVEFCETDAAGIAHFSALLCYMEQAEHAFWRFLGVSVMADLGDGWHLSWPRVHVECDFKGAAKFEDELEIEVAVERIGRSSLTTSYTVSRDGTTIATGKTTAVCCKVRAASEMASMEIPSDLRARLEDYLQQGDGRKA
ncbi:MAG: acyl-CoA thioesterase [Planctomycetota bacterium]|nr:MAG: acyl-CoA thioesterase [Planctomycetota bacterium]